MMYEGLLARLKENDTSLKMFRVGGTRIETRKGMDEFIRAFEKNTMLKTLMVSYCVLGNEGSAALGRVLAKNNTLTSLDIAYVKFGTEAKVTLKHAIYENGMITKTAITDNDLKAYLEPCIERNVLAHQRCREAVTALLVIGTFKRGESCLLWGIPKEIVACIAKHVWGTRSDFRAWNCGKQKK